MKNLNKKIIVKTVKVICIIFVSTILLTVSYSLIFEQDKINIDKYNFEQLEKVKMVLDGLDKNLYIFNNLKEYNNKYSQDVKPIKNCYFLAYKNGFFKDGIGGGYIFGFKLESIFYKIKHLNWYYVYPKYDLPYGELCIIDSCTDRNYNGFTYTISNPCRD